MSNPTKEYKMGAKDLQAIVQGYFKSVLKLPCPDFTWNLQQKDEALRDTK